MRSMDNRNMMGGDINDMFIFNEIIGHLGLLELPIKVEATLGSICKIIHYWNSWIGSLLPQPGFLATLSHRFFL